MDGIFLEVVSGCLAGTTRRLEPVATSRVGSGWNNEIRIPFDQSLRVTHFAVSGTKDGQLHIYNFSVDDPIVVNGEPVNEAPLKQGDWIVAGETSFMVTSVPEMGGQGSPISTLYQYLTKVPSLFLLLDEVTEPEAIGTILSAGGQGHRLVEDFELNVIPERPWLFVVEPGQWLLYLLRTYWGQGRLVFLSSRATYSEIGTHLRPYLFLRTPDGELAHFRFYDPRILRIALKQGAPDHIEQLFGPIDQFLLEDRWPRSLLVATPVGLTETPISEPYTLIPTQSDLEQELSNKPVLEPKDLCHFCRRNYPIQTARWTNEHLEKVLAGALSSARGRGFTRPGAVAQFALVSLAIGQNFIISPSVEDWFRSSKLELESTLDFFVMSLNHSRSGAAIK